MPNFCRDDGEDDNDTNDGDGDVVSGVSEASFSGTMWSREATVQAGEAQGKQEMWETRIGTRGVGGVCKCWLICNLPSRMCERTSDERDHNMWGGGGGNRRGNKIDWTILLLRIGVQCRKSEMPTSSINKFHTSTSSSDRVITGMRTTGKDRRSLMHDSRTDLSLR